MQFENKVAIVTGGSRGIGRAVSEALAREGAQVVIAGRDLSVAREVESAIGADRALAVATDVTVPADNHRMVSAALERFGQVDVLITCAAIILPSKFLDITEEHWANVMNVNINGTFNSIKAVLPHMLERNEGKIVTNTSLRGMKSLGNWDYGTSKAAVIQMTTALARELRAAKTRINVNCVSPVAETRMSEALANFRGQTLDQFRASRPGYMLVPEDTVSTYLFLASDAAKFISGQVVAVDDGASI